MRVGLLKIHQFNLLIPNRLSQQLTRPSGPKQMSSNSMNQTEASNKRELEDTTPNKEEPPTKAIKSADKNEPNSPTIVTIEQSPRRLIPQNVLNKLTPEDIQLLTGVKTSCTDLEKIAAAYKLRKKHRLCPRLPEDPRDTEFYIENGLRKLYPYPYLFQTFAKRRWQGRRLINVLRDEFRDISEDDMKLRFSMQRVLINGLPVGHDYVLKDNDFIMNRTHRHELPVLAAPIKILHKDRDILVVNKPPSIPIHACGRFRHNSIISILEEQYGFEDIRIVHRLDRLVSGVLMIAFNAAKAHQLENLMVERNVQKEYVCRVVGEFPLGDPENDGEILVDQPLHPLEGKIGVSVVMEGGKPSQTYYKRLSYNGKTSAVLCRPKTGRTHQIRVHLQFLGHPIVNDLLYNCDSFGPEKGKGGRYGKSYAQLSKDVIAKHRASTWLAGEHNDVIDPAATKTVQATDSIDPESNYFRTARFLSDEEKIETLSALEGFYDEESLKDLEDKHKFDPKKVRLNPECRDCKLSYHDPPLRSLLIYLHALSYSGPDWSYRSDLPSWALDTWKY